MLSPETQYWGYVQEVGGAAAEELAGELPGLVVVRGGKAQVTNPREHEQLLEKVRLFVCLVLSTAPCASWLPWDSLCVRIQRLQN